jgi:hypothetical protein
VLAGNGPNGRRLGSMSVGENRCGQCWGRNLAPAPPHAAGELEVRFRAEDLAVGEMRQPAGVIGVEVRQHDPPHVVGREAEAT